MQQKPLTAEELVALSVKWGIHYIGIDDSEAALHFTLAHRYATKTPAGVELYNNLILQHSNNLQTAALELPKRKQNAALSFCLRMLELAGVVEEEEGGQQ